MLIVPSGPENSFRFNRGCKTVRLKTHFCTACGLGLYTQEYEALDHLAGVFNATLPSLEAVVCLSRVDISYFSLFFPRFFSLSCANLVSEV